jgi:AGZA family xanthine/uracil permease-like MFS transporter
MQLQQRLFRLQQNRTTVAREVVAGLVTFSTLSYILFVQPAILSHPAAGMEPGGVLFATCVASAAACFLMGLLANLPVALAPAMGHNLFFVFTVCLLMGFRWQEALAANFVAGLVFLALSWSAWRERVMHALPRSLAAGITAGIGLLIALVGLEFGGLVADNPQTLVQLGDLGAPAALLALFGLLVHAILLARRVPGAILIGLFVTAAAGLTASRVFALETPLVVWQGVVGAPPAPSTAFELNLAGLFARPWSDWLAVIAIFLVLDLFDTIGSLLGLGRQAGLMQDDKLPQARQAFLADATGTTLGALLGTSTVTVYIESATGIAAGGRTGLTAVVVGLCFLAALVFSPLIATIAGGVPAGADGALLYPVIAPVLVLIGSMMMSSLREVDWKDPARAIPAFLTLLVMPLSFSITDGIAWGCIAASTIALGTGRPRSLSPLVHAFALLFVLRYAYMLQLA